jgi:hypothetical protein
VSLLSRKYGILDVIKPHEISRPVTTIALLYCFIPRFRMTQEVVGALWGLHLSSRRLIRVVRSQVIVLMSAECATDFLFQAQTWILPSKLQLLSPKPVTCCQSLSFVFRHDMVLNSRHNFKFTVSVDRYDISYFNFVESTSDLSHCYQVLLGRERLDE